MPYKYIVFVQLQRRLLNDHRWWTMSDISQLIYIKLLLVAAETNNKIPLNDKVLIQMMRMSLGTTEFLRCLKEISANFPNFKKNKHFRYVLGFSKYTNYIRKGQSSGMPKARQSKEHIYIDRDIDMNKDRDKRKRPSLEDLKPFFKDETQASSFFDFYTANGWKVGRNPMKDWKAAARNWQRRQGEFSKNSDNSNLTKAQKQTQASYFKWKARMENESNGSEAISTGNEHTPISLPKQTV